MQQVASGFYESIVSRLANWDPNWGAVANIENALHLSVFLFEVANTERLNNEPLTHDNIIEWRRLQVFFHQYSSPQVRGLQNQMRKLNHDIEKILWLAHHSNAPFVPNILSTLIPYNIKGFLSPAVFGLKPTLKSLANFQTDCARNGCNVQGHSGFGNIRLVISQLPFQNIAFSPPNANYMIIPHIIQPPYPVTLLATLLHSYVATLANFPLANVINVVHLLFTAKTRNPHRPKAKILRHQDVITYKLILEAIANLHVLN